MCKHNLENKKIEESFQKIKNSIEYVENNKAFVNVYNWMENLQDKTVVAFGLGKFFRDTHERLYRMCRIDYLCDNNPDYWGKEIFGKTCISIEKLKGLENAFVIAVVGNYEPIRIQMEELEIDSIHISEMHFEHYCKGVSLGWLKESLPDIKKSMELLADEKSLQVFTEVTCKKLTGSKLSDYTYSQLATNGEYFQQGIWELQGKECFVDVGAYDGDTVEDFIHNTNGNFKTIFALELIKENALQLKKRVSGYEDHIRQKIKVLNMGAWDRKDMLLCGGYGDPDGYGVVDENRFTGESERCQLDALDSVIPEEETVTVLKMDIEGAEEKALEGARRILTEDAPKLAICLYHRPDDFWRIPLKIKEINPNYAIYMRHHSYVNYTDTVLYAYVKQ